MKKLLMGSGSIENYFRQRNPTESEIINAILFKSNINTSIKVNKFHIHKENEVFSE